MRVRHTCNIHNFTAECGNGEVSKFYVLDNIKKINVAPFNWLSQQFRSPMQIVHVLVLSIRAPQGAYGLQDRKLICF